jgi:hypothetical protein
VITIITYNVVPAENPTFKYERLGKMAIANHRRYCERHGYRFISDVEVAVDRPACWAKIPAILKAFEHDRWVLWADSDALVLDPSRRIEDFCDPGFDLIVASHDEYFRRLGIPIAEGLARMPINTGVLLMQASAWSKEFLLRAYEQRQFVLHGEIWNGIGEQEAMIHLLQEQPSDRRRIKYVTGLQNHPKLYRDGDLFAHFYGNHARHRIPLSECEEMFRHWEDVDSQGGALPPDRMRFHWCSIQNKQARASLERGDLSRYLYRLEDIAPLVPCNGTVQ